MILRSAIAEISAIALFVEALVRPETAGGGQLRFLESGFRLCARDLLIVLRMLPKVPLSSLIDGRDVLLGSIRILCNQHEGGLADDYA